MSSHMLRMLMGNAPNDEMVSRTSLSFDATSTLNFLACLATILSMTASAV